MRAFSLPLKELENAVFFRGEGEFEPHYAVTASGFKVSRVNVWGVVWQTFESENDFASISIDDFTGTIDVKAFKERLKDIKKVKKGDTVKVIGKVRENNNKIYVLAEGIQKISFEEELLERLDKISTIKFAEKTGTKKEKNEKAKKTIAEDLNEFQQASELKIEREVVK
ncbi:MAG: OB-fold nucleic acid binding domain-containing protein [Candidatus Diapherotrites archaeon]